MSEIPTYARVDLHLEAEGQVLELSADESRQVLGSYPDLLQYRKFSGMTNTKGRIIVIDKRRVIAILRLLGRDQTISPAADAPENR